MADSRSKKAHEPLVLVANAPNEPVARMWMAFDPPLYKLGNRKCPVCGKKQTGLQSGNCNSTSGTTS